MLARLLRSAKSVKSSKGNDYMTAEHMAKLNPPKPKFYPLRESPHSELRQMHQQIIEHSSCPECLDLGDRLPEEQWEQLDKIPGGSVRRDIGAKSTSRPEYTCPSCGFPSHCAEDHHMADGHTHSTVCQELRQWSEDEHDLRSGRKFWEYSFPGWQEKNSVMNFTNWPAILKTRKFPKPILQSSISQRHISRVLTYPYTIAAMLNNPWVYADDTDEGSKSKSVVTDAGWHLLSSLSHAIDVGVKSSWRHFDQNRGPKRRAAFTDQPTSPTLTSDPFRIFILGARMESQLPAFVWEQLSLSFPGVPMRLYFIGPESRPPSVSISSGSGKFTADKQRIIPTSHVHKRPVNSRTVGLDGDGQEVEVKSIVYPVSVNMRMEYIAAQYEDVHETFGPFQRNRDVFVCFNSGVGHPLTENEWKPALKHVLKTRCLTIFTSMNKSDQMHDVDAIKRNFDGDYVVVLRPTFNKFSSLRPDFSVDTVHDPDEWTYCNWGIFALHGIGNEVGDKRDDFKVEVGDSRKSWWSW